MLVPTFKFTCGDISMALEKRAWHDFLFRKKTELMTPQKTLTHRTSVTHSSFMHTMILTGTVGTFVEKKCITV
jgi:hypothetical protein